MKSPASQGFWPEWLTPRRVFEFARNVGLERSVEQQKVLLSFIAKALDERVKARAEEAVADAMQKPASASRRQKASGKRPTGRSK